MKIRFDNVFIIVFFLIYLKPFNTSFWGIFDTFLQFAKIIISFILLVLLIKRNKKISKVSIVVMLFLCSWSLALIMNNMLFENLIYLISIACMFLFVDLYRGSSKNEKSIFKCLYWIAAFYIVLHTLTIFMGHPFFGVANDYDRYFLGGDNRSAFILIILCTLLYIYDVQYCELISVRTFTISLIGLVGLIYVFSVAGMIAYSLLLLAIFLRKHKFLKVVFSVKCILLLMVAVVVSVVVFHIEDKLSSILALFNKTGLSSREVIWPLAVRHFLERKFFGYGALSPDQVRAYYLYGAGHTHNMLLEILMMTGIVGFTLFFYLMHIIVRKSKRNETKMTYYICMFGLAAYCLCAIFDFYIELIYFYLLLALITLIKESEDSALCISM